MSPLRREPDLSTFSGRFADRLRELRSKTNLTLHQVADKLRENGIDTSYRSISRWEAGETDPPIKAFPALASAYNVTVRSLLPKE